MNEPDLFEALVEKDAITLDDYILALQDLKKLHGGDVKVQKWLPSRGRFNATMPRVAFARRLVLRQGAQTVYRVVPQFWQAEHDEAEMRGELVIRI